MNATDRIKFASDDNEIAKFLSSTVSKELSNKTRNERDTVIINQLIQYVNSLTTDKSNLVDLVSDLDSDINKLNDEVFTLKHENSSLIEQQQVQNKVLQEQKDDFINALSQSQENLLSSGNETTQIGSIKTAIRRVFSGSENEFDDVKERIEERQMQNYKQALDEQNKVRTVPIMRYIKYNPYVYKTN